MERNIKVYRAHRALAVLYAILAALAASFWIAKFDEIGGEMLAPLLLVGLLFCVHLFTARGARAGKPGARIASIVIAVLMLAGFPLGTLIGLYLLANSWQAWDTPRLGVAG